MSTRGIFCVVEDNEYKLAIYNHFDSYPSGLGVDILKILRENGYGKLSETVRNMKKLTQKMFDEKCIEIAGSLDKYVKYGEEIQYQIKKDVRDMFPEPMVLDILNNTTGYYTDYLNFAADSLFCEWGYVIDLDKKTFEVFKGFNEEPLTENERFFFLSDKIRNEKYYPIKFVASFDLENLPNDNNFLELTEKE